jgi:hypothetical protein
MPNIGLLWIDDTVLRASLPDVRYRFHF